MSRTTCGEGQVGGGDIFGDTDEENDDEEDENESMEESDEESDVNDMEEEDENWVFRLIRNLAKDSINREGAEMDHKTLQNTFD